MTEKLRLRLSEIEERAPITSDDELIEALEEIISGENQKPLKEADTDLISMCVDIMLDIEGIDVDAIKKEDEQRSTRIKEKIDKKQRKKRLINRKLFRPIVAVASAVFVLLAVTTVAYALGFEPIRYIKQFLGIPVGDSVSVDNVTYIHGGEVVYYSTVEELNKENDIDILFPAYLPDNIILDKIGVNAVALDDIDITFEFSSDKLIYIAYNYPVNNFEIIEKQIQPYVSDGISYYVYEDNMNWTAYFEYNDIQYILRYSNYDELMKMIDSIMKGTNK